MLQAALGVFNCLLAIAKCWVQASCLKPCAGFPCSAQSDTPRVDRDKIVKLLQRFRVFPKVRVDGCTQKGSLDEPWILPERFIAIRNGELVLPLPCKNLRALLEREPEFWVSVQSRVHVALRTGQIAIFQLLFRLVTQIHRCTPAGTARDDDRHACMRSCQADDKGNEESNYVSGHNLVGLVGAICNREPSDMARQRSASLIAALAA
jgi:hypothetical protein